MATTELPTHPPGDPRAWLDEASVQVQRAGLRHSGLYLLFGFVLLGLLPASYYMFARPRMEAAYAAELAAAPTTSTGRIQKWFDFGAAMIHHRIARVGRFSDEHPWIVTHTTRVAGGEPGVVEAYGIDASRLSPGMSRLEGLTVVVDLPAPGPLGPLRLSGDRARFLPVLAADEAPTDPVVRLRELVLWFLEGLPDALADDIEGASLELRIGGTVVVPRRGPAPEGAPDSDPGETAQPDPVGGR